MDGINEKDLERIGNLLLGERNKRGFTQQKVCNLVKEVNPAIHLKSSYLSKIENGHKELPVRTLSALCVLYGLSIGQVLQPELIRPEDADPVEFKIPGLSDLILQFLRKYRNNMEHGIHLLKMLFELMIDIQDDHREGDRKLLTEQIRRVVTEKASVEKKSNRRTLKAANTPRKSPEIDSDTE